MQKKRNFVAQKSIGIKDMSQKEIHLKAVLFDMDGVLFNSMPYHAEAWHKVMQAHGLNLSREEAYLHEGRTGAGTINIVSQRQLGREATKKVKSSTNSPNPNQCREPGSYCKK